MAILGRRREWVRYQGRANAALMLLARAMDAEFVAPLTETDFAAVRGRSHGCMFELAVDDGAGDRDPVLVASLRHFHTQTGVRLEGRGCTVPELDPDRMRDTLERACQAFTTAH